MSECEIFKATGRKVKSVSECQECPFRDTDYICDILADAEANCEKEWGQAMTRCRKIIEKWIGDLQNERLPN